MRPRKPAAVPGSGEAQATKRSRTVGSSWKTKGRIGSNDRSRAVARSHHPRTNPSCTGNLLAVLRAGESLWSPRQGAGEVYTPAGLEVATRPDSRWHGAAPPMWHPCLLESGPPCSGHPCGEHAEHATRPTIEPIANAERRRDDTPGPKSPHIHRYVNYPPSRLPVCLWSGVERHVDVSGTSCRCQ